MSNEYVIYPQPGVITKKSDPTFGQAISYAHLTDNDILVGVLRGGETAMYPIQDFTRGESPDRLEFDSGDEHYLIRELREEDGVWVSRYKTALPIEALEDLISGDTMTDLPLGSTEKITAYALDDSSFVVGLTYANADGTYTRADGEWVQSPDDDTTFDGMISMEIDPDKADDYVDLYDRNFVSVVDTETYESVAPEEPDLESAVS
jgi:hypothetical protein